MKPTIHGYLDMGNLCDWRARGTSPGHWTLTLGSADLRPAALEFEAVTCWSHRSTQDAWGLGVTGSHLRALDAAKGLLASPRPRMAGADSKWVNSPSDRGHETSSEGATRRPSSRTHRLSAPSRRPDVDDGSRTAHCACGCRVAPPEILSPAAMLQPLLLASVLGSGNIRSRDVPCAVCERIGRALHVMRPATELGLAPDKRSEVCRAPCGAEGGRE